MSLCLNLSLRRIPVGYSWAQTGMRTSPVVVRRPGFENLTDVRFVEWNHEIQTLSACAADESFAESIRLGRLVRRFQYGNPERFQGCIQLFGINTVAIADEKPISLTAGDALSELL
jgi:hypothetical protein